MDFTVHQSIKIIAVIAVSVIIITALLNLDSVTESKQQMQSIADINQSNREKTANIKASFYYKNLNFLKFIDII